MISVRREFEFCAAHRLEGHKKCGRLHGHNYKVVVTVSAPDVDQDTGMVMDFKDLKRVVEPIIDELDHRYMASVTNIAAKDPYEVTATERGDSILLDVSHTTAENIAGWLRRQIVISIQLRGYAEHDVHVELYETPSSSAKV